MPQDRRNNAIERFRNGTVNVLLATDVAARGIDLPDVITRNQLRHATYC